MTASDKPIDQLLETLQERAKELNCLYVVDEILADADAPLKDVGPRLVAAIPAGWKYPEACGVRLSVRDLDCATPGFAETPWVLQASIPGEGEEVGHIAVHYQEEKPPADDGPFLREERKLIDTIAQRIGFFITRGELRRAHESLQAVRAGESGSRVGEWRIVLDFLRSADPHLLRRITRRMVNHLRLSGVSGAEGLLRRFLSDQEPGEAARDNVPQPKVGLEDLASLSEETYDLAGRHLSDEEIAASIRSWIDEDRSSFLIEVLEDQTSALPEIVEAIGRHRSLIGGAGHLPLPFRRSLSAALLFRLFTDEVSYINVMRDLVELEDVFDLVSRIVHPLGSHGKLGGKSAGVFFASQALRRAASSSTAIGPVLIPRTWYVSSDAVLEFLKYNDLRELYFRKYMDIDQVRQEYPHILHLFKNSSFPPEVSRGLAFALEDLEGRPIIVRSSSLLEDRMGSSFAGKYKSLFLANQGTRKERLEALEDAIAEIYASIFGPDPIEYRSERGLLDIHEEMAIIIQEVVGSRVGPYFLPAFSGVAFSRNELRWSARIAREDGLIRMVPGLGTRAVDRVGEDYPVLICPGQPGLRVNVTPEEVVRYAPRLVDVINLERGGFESIAIDTLLREHGEDYPAVRQMVSIVSENGLRRPMGLEPDFATDRVVVTFDGLITGTPFVSRIGTMLALLEDRLGKPIDLEFASDGTNLYILQCRAQSESEAFASTPIPRSLPADMILFAADRSISNGRVPDIRHIVYVDPDRYAALGELRELLDVGRAVGRLNRILPRKQFILMGPGRWGSRGDVRLGVRVTYADISNTAVLMEIAHRQGSYLPELSFGTHFFQDLVEADIRYIPLYPGEGKGHLDVEFLRSAPNRLPELLPEFSGLAEVVRVIDVAAARDGRVLRILLNADIEEAVGFFDVP